MDSPDILYEDDRLVAAAKPAGLASIRERTPSGESLHEALSRRLGRKLFVVHRLDRGTSGVILFAKDAASHKDLCARFEDRRVLKTYLALARGAVPSSEGEIDRPLRSFGSGRVGVGEPGKPSVTRYRVLEHLPAATLLKVRPLTDRRHQIRVHLYALSHPVLSDTLYGDERPVDDAPHLMLHALEVDLGDPGPRLRAEPPADFLRALEEARKTRPLSP